jgi:hypothetical protein
MGEQTIVVWILIALCILVLWKKIDCVEKQHKEKFSLVDNLDVAAVQNLSSILSGGTVTIPSLTVTGDLTVAGTSKLGNLTLSKNYINRTDTELYLSFPDMKTDTTINLLSDPTKTDSLAGTIRAKNISVATIKGENGKDKQLVIEPHTTFALSVNALTNLRVGDDFILGGNRMIAERMNRSIWISNPSFVFVANSYTTGSRLPNTGGIQM